MTNIPKPQTASKSPRTRSPAYPIFSLRSAVEAAEKMWKAQGKHVAHLDSVLQTIGYTKRTGISLRAVAALNQYGLTKETGSGDDRNIGLSDLALDILVGSAEQKREGLRTAAIKPIVYDELWTRYGEHPPADEVIRTFLVREKSFNPAVVDAIVEDYRITIEYANLHGNIGNDAKTLSAETGKFAVSSGSVVMSKGSSAAPMTANVRYLPIPLDIGDAPIPVGMSDSDFDLLLETLKLWKKKIVRPPTHEFSFNSLADLDRQIKTFREQHPRATLDDVQVGSARRRAQDMDNDGETVGERVTFNVVYTTIP